MINNISVIKLIATVLFFVFSLINQPIIFAHELSGYLAGEGRLFFNDALFPGQDRDNVSIALQPEYYHEWESGSSFIFVPFARLDSADPERSHFDVREFNYLWLNDNWELRIGIGKVFWGVTESQHLVDVINQTDAIESPAGEDKLGQPMINLSLPFDWGTWDFFLLPYFRERTFPGKKGRLRNSLIVNTDKATYESSEEERHLDVAVRYSHTIRDWEIGLSHFRGTGREPALRLGVNKTKFIPYYEQISQTGMDIQLVRNEWLYKFEGIYRSGQQNLINEYENFYALTAGFEYTFYGIGKGMDIGVIGEWLYDDRDDLATSPTQNDIMAGIRLVLNDVEGTEFLMWIVQDVKRSSRMFTLEGNRRLSDHWKITLETYFFFDQTDKDFLYGLRDDDYFQMELAYYF